MTEWWKLVISLALIRMTKDPEIVAEENRQVVDGRIDFYEDPEAGGK
jgi:hypothetical protein